MQAGLALCVLAAALAGCAGKQTGGGGLSGSTTELKTASDETSVEKRAGIPTHTEEVMGHAQPDRVDHHKREQGKSHQRAAACHPRRLHGRRYRGHQHAAPEQRMAFGPGQPSKPDRENTRHE